MYSLNMDEDREDSKNREVRTQILGSRSVMHVAFGEIVRSSRRL